MTAAIFMATVLAGVAGPLATKLLLREGLDYNALLFWRSMIVILAVLPFSLRRAADFTAIWTRISALRLLVGGTVLTLTVFAYRSLSATEVNLLARLDLPIFLVLFGAGTRKMGGLALVAAGAVYSGLTAGVSTGPAVAAIWGATLLTAISYWLIRRSAATRSLGALVLPPYLGAVLVSLGLGGRVPAPPPVALLPLLLTTSICAILLYVLCASLFRRARLGAAELTGCIALLCTYLVEGYVVGEAPSGAVGIATAASVVFGLILVYWEEIPLWLKTAD